MKIVCIGDSLTFGYGVSCSQSWVSLLKHHFDFDIINKGINGDTTTSLLNRSYKDIIQLNPNHVIIMCGTNDFLMGSPSQRAFKNISYICTESLEHHITPIVIIPPPVYPSLAAVSWDNSIDYQEVNKKIELLGNFIKSFCSTSDIAIINLYEEFSKITEHISDYYTDGVHLSAVGHMLIYQHITKQSIFDKSKKK